MTPESATLNHRGAVRPPAATKDYFLRQGLLKLLAIKDSDVRLLCLEQCRDAVDKRLHAGGAFSATIPFVALYCVDWHVHSVDASSAASAVRRT